MSSQITAALIEGLPFPALDDFLGSSAAKFFASAWQRETLVFPAARRERRLATVAIDFRDVTRLALKSGRLELLGGKDGGPAPGEPGWPETEGCRSARVSRAQEHAPVLQALCARLSDEISHRVSANLYVSPPRSRALDRHHDGHDVLVLQLEGQKRWKVWRSDAPPPLDTLPALTFENQRRVRADYRGTPYGGHGVPEEEVTEDPVLDIEARPGDLFYVPRGWAHEVWTEGVHSAHLTFGLHLVSWVDLLLAAVSQSSRRHAGIRQTLPIGFARVSPEIEGVRRTAREMIAHMGDADGAEALEEVISRWVCRDLSKMPDDPKTEPPPVVPELRVRRTTPLAVVYRQDTVGLFRPSHSLSDVWFPAAFSKALRFVATVEPPEFAVADVPGVSASGRNHLCRLLLAQGYLQPLTS